MLPFLLTNSTPDFSILYAGIHIALFFYLNWNLYIIVHFLPLSVTCIVFCKTFQAVFCVGFAFLSLFSRCLSEPRHLHNKDWFV